MKKKIFKILIALSINIGVILGLLYLVYLKTYREPIQKHNQEVEQHMAEKKAERGNSHTCVPNETWMDDDGNIVTYE